MLYNDLVDSLTCTGTLAPLVNSMSILVPKRSHVQIVAILAVLEQLPN